jgi:hypothetical protein
MWKARSAMGAAGSVQSWALWIAERAPAVYAPGVFAFSSSIS